jgi:Flp pilus assembly protein TadB
MPAFTTVAALAGLGLASQERDYQANKQNSAMNKMVAEQEAAQAESEAKMKNQEAKQSRSKELQQQRLRQKAQQRGYAGRTSTILTSPLGSAPEANTAGGKTLLGS